MIDTGIYCVIAAFCGIFWMMNLLERRVGKDRYPLWMQVLFYVFSRADLMAMIQMQTLGMWRNFTLDLLGFLVLLLLTNRYCTTRRAANLGMGYVFQPLLLLGVVTGNTFWMVVLLLSAAVAATAVFLNQRKRHLHLGAFYPEYILANVGIFIWILCMDRLNYTLPECVQAPENIPMYMALAMIWTVAAVVCGITRIINRNSELYQIAAEVSNSKAAIGGEESQNHTDVMMEEGAIDGQEHRIFDLRDLIWMLVLTFCYGALVFFRLGSTNAPESEFIFAPDQEVVLDLGAETKVSKISMYLGYESERHFDLLSQQKEDGPWKAVFRDKKVQSVFCWNGMDIEIDEPVRYLKLTAKEAEAYVMELVILDENGERIVPVNVGSYGELFDEQDTYPKYRTYYNGTMFDEVYHARTAYEMVHDLPIYEIAHPPFGKIILSIGIRIFGMNPFGWRFMCALCGTLMVPVIYGFAHLLWRRRAWSIGASLLYCFSFMNYVLSRIATLDIIVALFILFMFFFLYGFLVSWKKNRVFVEVEAVWQEQGRRRVGKEVVWILACGLATAVGIATKWTAVYAAAGLAVILGYFLLSVYAGKPMQAGRRKHLRILFWTCVVSFFLFPVALYIVSYIPFVQVDSTRSLAQFAIDNAVFMLQYHEGAVAWHPYQSQWYNWLYDQKPLLDVITRFGDGTVSSITTFGNPLLLLLGMISVVYNIYLWRVKRDQNAAFLTIAYFTMLIPWTYIHRTVFLYQYFVCILILIFSMGNACVHWKRWGKRILYIGIGLAGILFVVFYPQLSGFAVSENWIGMRLLY